MAILGKSGPRRCKIFNCDRRHGSFCCADCGVRRCGGCRNPCLNSPEQCGQVAPSQNVKEESQA